MFPEHPWQTLREFSDFTKWLWNTDQKATAKET